jgi:hypothetical protein
MNRGRGMVLDLRKSRLRFFNGACFLMEFAMKRSVAIALSLVLVSVLGIAQKTKKHNDVPAAFETAHSVFVEAEDGDIGKAGVSSADRQAIADVQDALHVWNRYVLAVHPEQADLIFVVRKGRPANPADQSGLNTGPRTSSHAPGQSPGGLPGQGGDSDSLGAPAAVGQEEDRLRVYAMVDGKQSGPIWTRELRNGLDGPSLVIVQQLKLAVERAYPTPAAAAPSGKPDS